MKWLAKKRSVTIAYLKQIIQNGVIYNNKDQICTELNKYLVNVGPDYASKIPHVNTDYKTFLNKTNIPKLDNNKLTYKEFEESISHLKSNKAACFDDLNSNIVLHIISVIKGPLFHILNLSICEGVFPELLKISKVNPIFKEGDRSELCNTAWYL